MTIPVSLGGGEYATAVIADEDDNEINDCDFEIAWGNAYKPAGPWVAADVREDINATTVKLKAFVTNLTPGQHFLWVRIADNPELLFRRSSNAIIIT